MKALLIGLSLLVISTSSRAGEEADCVAAAGAYRTGVVVQGPRFAHGQFRKGIELSHTHLSLLADQDGKTYDVAIDNVFAAGFDPRVAAVPAPINSIRLNDKVEVCGALYTKGFGLHWVHVNCGGTPSASHPNGWLKLIDRNGGAGANLEGSVTYCSVFGAAPAAEK
ncbi:hypothetical protein Q4S45_08550 [Massilia sp. R2A-15]|uniref:hypothetical protein n=1 Tax=Massilia sp. R2A-15 TaxID=3064278 RepID=UPI0027342420|nr:hypothetical protein [Massilia sp. R2A-15]WLI91154.1 hypothetical protein Q4S45_08550 [Massilia sp. R2A-15]